MRSYHVIDADGHLLESVGLDWQRYLEEPYRDRAPKVIPFETGGGRLFIEGEIWTTPYRRGHAVRGASPTDMHALRPGMWEPQPRLQDMDLDGIDVSVLFGGTIGLGASGIRDGKLAGALCRAYNTWAAEFCQADPSRLKFAAAMPWQDVEEAVAEAHRAVSELGAVGLDAPPNFRGKNLNDPSLDPVWAEAERLSTAVGVHMIAINPGIASAGLERFDDMFRTQVTTHPLEQMIAFMCVTGGGVLDRFPKLRVAFLEGWCGWLPFWAQRLDEHYETWGWQVPAKAKPSEYLTSGRVFVSCESGEQTLRHVIDAVGDDMLVYASDYWHFDARFPGTVKEISERANLSMAEKRRLLGENAARLYGLATP